MIREDGGEPVDAQPHSTGGRKAVFERGQEVLVHRMRLVIARRASPGLVFEAGSLVVRIVELREGVRDLLARNEELEAIGQARVTGTAPRQWRNLDWVPEDERRLHQRVLHEFLE